MKSNRSAIAATFRGPVAGENLTITPIGGTALAQVDQKRPTDGKWLHARNPTEADVRPDHPISPQDRANR
ncbi:hypothetical protein AB0F15_06830 [Amycolatopsis sp. NPDC026612]|uniref:hypothetical protein n=1 Tax=Amycolatopsis sp. NPDC026612 TaxID=3155466 RepID=UPI0033D10C2C